MMNVNQSNFAKLQDLAKEPSSTKRRELLREVTDMFFEGDQARSDEEAQLFDDILGTVAKEMEIEVRAELAEKVSNALNAPRSVARRFAMDEIEVAAPVLARSRALTDKDLVDVVETRGQGHMLAVTRRETLSEEVSGAIVNRGDDSVVASLLKNDGAKLSRSSYEQVTDRAQTSKKLQAPLVKRQSVPLDLLNEMYMVVSEKLRNEITERNDKVSPEELEAALARSRVKVAKSVGALPKDYDAASTWFETQKRLRQLNPQVLVPLLRSHEVTKFLLAFAELTEIDFHTAQKIMDSRDIDALAMLCRASDFERALFVTIAVLIGGKTDNSIKSASDFGDMYKAIPIQAAQRAVRFWRVRKTQERRVA